MEIDDVATDDDVLADDWILKMGDITREAGRTHNPADDDDAGLFVLLVAVCRFVFDDGGPCVGVIT